MAEPRLPDGSETRFSESYKKEYNYRIYIVVNILALVVTALHFSVIFLYYKSKLDLPNADTIFLNQLVVVNPVVYPDEKEILLNCQQIIYDVLTYLSNWKKVVPESNFTDKSTNQDCSKIFINYQFDKWVAVNNKKSGLQEFYADE